MIPTSLRKKTLLGAMSILLLSSFSASAVAAEAPVYLGTAADFVALAHTTVTSTDTAGTILIGDLGVWPGDSITGFPPGVVIGTIHAGDPVAQAAKGDLSTAFLDAAGRSTAPVTVAGNIGGMTLAPGLYKSTSSLEITSGDLTLDAQGDQNAVWIFQIASTLTTTENRQVILTNGAQASNVFWQVGSSATIGTGSIFQGTIMAQAAVTLQNEALLNGRALAMDGAVTLDANAVSKPIPAVESCQTFAFGASAEGWNSHTLPDFFTIPNLSYNVAAPGTLDITATDNQNNFGYWESPTFGLTAPGAEPKSSSIPLPVMQIDGTSIFAVKANFVGNASDASEVPDIRLRTTATNSQQADLAVMSSNIPGAISPHAGSGTEATLYFKPATDSPDFRIQFDMLNFALDGNSPSATVALDSLSICEFNELDLAMATTEARFTFDSSDENWTPKAQSDAGFVSPAYSYNAEAGGITLTTVPSDGKYVFGYWGSPEVEPLVRPVAGRLYFAEFTVESDQADASLVPSFRVRINESGFRIAQLLQASPTGTAQNSPTIGNPKTYTVFFPPNLGTDGGFLIYSFDIITRDEEGHSMTASLTLTDLHVRSIEMPQ